MAMTSAERRELMARARELPARSLIGKAGLTEAVMGQIRASLAGGQLLKLRLPKDREEAAEIIRRIQAEGPCELIGRVGFTAVFRAVLEKSPSE